MQYILALAIGYLVGKSDRMRQDAKDFLDEFKRGWRDAE